MHGQQNIKNWLELFKNLFIFVIYLTTLSVVATKV